jgi:hypothetical protein
VVLVSSAVGSALRRGGEGRSDGGAPPDIAEDWPEDACEGGRRDEEDVRDEQLQVCVCQRKGESAPLVPPPPPLKKRQHSLVDARQHDEAVHEQQAEAGAAHQKHQQSDPDLPAQPGPEQKAAEEALAEHAALGIAPAAAHERADAAGGPKVVVVLVFALGGAADARVGARGAAANVDERHGGLQLRLRVLRRVAAAGLHLCVEFYVRVVRVIDGARAVVAALGVAVRLLGVGVGGQLAREGAEEVEGLAEGRLRVAVEAQRVHAARCIAGEKETYGMESSAAVQKVSTAYNISCGPEHRAVLWLPSRRGWPSAPD